MVPTQIVISWGLRPALLLIGVALIAFSLMAGGVSVLIAWDLPMVASQLWAGSQIALAIGVGLLLSCWASDQLRGR